MYACFKFNTNKLSNYRPQRSWGKVMFLQASVILLMGVCLPQCMLEYTPIAQDQVHPPRPGTPPKTRCTIPQGQAHPPRPGTPPTRYTPQDKVHPLKTRYTPPKQVHPPTTTAAGSTHPTGMHSCCI